MVKMNKLSKHFLCLTIIFLSEISFINVVFADSKGKAFHIGEVVQGDTHGFKVIKAEVTNEFKDMHGKVSPSQPSHKLLVIKLKFFENKTPLKDKDKEQEEMHKLSMIDAKGRIYSSPLTESNDVIFRYILYGANPKEAYEKEGFIYQVFFSVPKKSSGFRLQYRDLPQVSLGL
jgi:hypothetical protein